MAVSSETSSISYTANGVTTAFAVPFPFLRNDQLVVTVDGVAAAYGADYTVTGAGGASGTVTFSVAPADTLEVVIERTVVLTQLTAFRSQGSFSPAVHEDALDHLTMAVQQIQRQVDDLVARVAALEA